MSSEMEIMNGYISIPYKDELYTKHITPVFEAWSAKNGPDRWIDFLEWIDHQERMRTPGLPEVDIVPFKENPFFCEKKRY
jgi:hypothetical protein